ncbi:double zinc ribbon and ankyrin repeat-containing protein 1-like isoform X1 [Asterias rubens]|uniref:double zinc ribbon and ankyrin repeat-containing protein 1-like isoform X1 n=1 Tax=Asterias rubens TaxID=7604 RepID=UPI0014553B01|nr:double zinc ribbon and ankyrin repeat-containing protein 1-like isoform X1 [Asterias rubens]
MPSAGAIGAPSIIPLRVPQPGRTANQIDTNTLIEIKSATPDAIIYISTNGNRPDPYRKGDKNTIKYKGPFLLNEGKRAIKAIAVSSDRRSESHVVSKVFSVTYAHPEPEPFEDDDASFIMDSRPKSSLRRSNQFSDVDDYIDLTRSSNNFNASKSYQVTANSGATVPYNAWGASTGPRQPQTVGNMQTNPDYMFHYHMHQQTSPRQAQPPVQYRQPPPQQQVQPPVIVDPYTNNWRPVSVPLPAVLNQHIGTQTVGLFYPTHEQLGRQERDVEEVRVMRDASSSMVKSEPKPSLMDTSPGKGYWKKQLAHVVAHLEAFTQREAEFRADIGKPKMGKITSASAEDDGVDVTITISFESQTESPNVRPNRASMARKEALLAKSLSESDSPYGKAKKKPITKKLAAKKKAVEDERLSEEDRHLLKELGAKGDGDPDNVQDLLDDGADPNCENKDGVHVLIEATINNHVECLPVLIDAGSKVNAKASVRKGNTALHEAVLLGPDGQEAIEALLEGSANPKAKNAKGETPYDLAVKNGYDSIVALFASSLGQDMLDKMSDTKKGGKAKAKKKAKAESDDEEEFVVKKRKAYKEKLPKDKGSVVAASSFDAQADSEKLRKAMKGLGTDEKAIIEVVTQRANQQRQKISKQFKQMFGKDLMKEFKGELGGKLLDVVSGLMMTPAKYDAYQLHKAIKGLGTDEAVLIEILCTRSNASIDAIKDAYETAYNKDLEEDVADDTSGCFQRMLVSVLQGARPEGDEVDPDKAAADAMALYKAGEDKWGTDESRFNAILISRSYAQLRATFEEYGKISKNDIEQAIKKEMSGDVKEGMLTVVRCVRNKHKFFSDRLHKCMKGAGTDDNTLMRIVVSRCEVDLQNIKAEFQSAFNQTLGKFIAGDTSGDYKKILLALVGGEN